MNETHRKLLEEIQALHERKAADYAQAEDPYSNFRKAAQVAAGFSGVDAVFATLIGVKLARIAELSDGRTPNNESLDDSFVDLTNYCAIWASFRRDARAAEPGPRVYSPPAEEEKENLPSGDFPPPPPYQGIRHPHVFYPMGNGKCAICRIPLESLEARKLVGCRDYDPDRYEVEPEG